MACFRFHMSSPPGSNHVVFCKDEKRNKKEGTNKQKSTNLPRLVKNLQLLLFVCLKQLVLFVEQVSNTNSSSKKQIGHTHILFLPQEKFVQYKSCLMPIFYFRVPCFEAVFTSLNAQRYITVFTDCLFLAHKAFLDGILWRCFHYRVCTAQKFFCYKLCRPNFCLQK